MAIALGLAVAPVMADMVDLSPCDLDVNGVVRPCLMTVEADDTRVFHAVGENGLTEDIVFNRMAAMAWARAQGLFADGTVFANDIGNVCDLPCEDCAAPAADQSEEPELEDPDPEEPDPEEPEVRDPEAEQTQ